MADRILFDFDGFWEKTYAVESPAAAPREPAASDVRAHAHGAEGDRGQDRGRDGRRHHPPLRQLQRDGGPGEPGLVERWALTSA